MSDDYLLIPEDPYARAAFEDRCAPRVKLSIPATLRVQNGRAFQSVVHDISIGGFCASAINRLPPGAVCWLTLPGLGSQQARVAWWNSSLVGCGFDRLLSPMVLDGLLARWQPSSAWLPVA